jgi:hypothetical protein
MEREFDDEDKLSKTQEAVRERECGMRKGINSQKEINFSRFLEEQKRAQLGHHSKKFRNYFRSETITIPH